MANTGDRAGSRSWRHAAQDDDENRSGDPISFAKWRFLFSIAAADDKSGRKIELSRPKPGKTIDQRKGSQGAVFTSHIPSNQYLNSELISVKIRVEEIERRMDHVETDIPGIRHHRRRAAGTNLDNEQNARTHREFGRSNRQSTRAADSEGTSRIENLRSLHTWRRSSKPDNDSYVNQRTPDAAQEPQQPTSTLGNDDASSQVPLTVFDLAPLRDVMMALQADPTFVFVGVKLDTLGRGQVDAESGDADITGERIHVLKGGFIEADRLEGEDGIDLEGESLRFFLHYHFL